MLKINYGNLFDNAKSDCIIAHGCNAMGVMHSGFAKELRLQFPDAYVIYNALHAVSPNNELTLGSIITCFTKNVLIVNCITQRSFGSGVCYADYIAIETALQSTAELGLFANKPIHIPLIGGGLGGGNKEMLVDSFKKVFKNADATLWLL